VLVSKTFSAVFGAFYGTILGFQVFRRRRIRFQERKAQRPDPPVAENLTPETSLTNGFDLHPSHSNDRLVSCVLCMQ
jgi:hypothetical protein